jgi:hypothetical protein
MTGVRHDALRSFQAGPSVEARRETEGKNLPSGLTANMDYASMLT